MKLETTLLLSFLFLGTANAWTHQFCFDDIGDCITVFTDKQTFLDSLPTDQVVRETVACSDEIHFAVEMPFIQGDMSFEIPDAYDSNSIALFGADHPRAVNFDGVPSYRFNAGRLTWDQGQSIKVGHPFTAMGFDVAHAVGGNRFAIDIFGKVFDDEYLYNDYWPSEWPTSDKSKAYFVGANAAKNKGSRFFGFVTNGNPVTEFTLGASERATPVNNPDAEKTFKFLATNFYFGVTDGSGPREISEECVYYHPKVCRARGYGDPHVQTFDGLHYDVHAKGEAIMLKSLQSDLEIQARFESTNHEDGSVGPSSTTGVVISYDDFHPNIQISVSATDTAAKRVPVLHGETCPVNLYVDGVEYNINSGYDDNGVTVGVDSSNTGFINIEYPDLELRLVTRKSVVSDVGACVFSIQYTLTEDCRPCEDLVGLLGNTNEDTQDDWMDLEGNSIPVPTSDQAKVSQAAYDYATQNWCITNAANSLFTYESADYDFDFFNYCDSPYDSSISDFVGAEDPDLEAICGDNLNCQLDSAGLGVEFAQDEEQLDWNDGDATVDDVEEPDEFDLFLMGEDDGSIQVIDIDGREIGTATPQKTWKDYRWCYYGTPTAAPTDKKPSYNTLGTSLNPFVPEVGTAAPTDPNPSSPSGSNGDPHFKTWRNEHYEYHGQCDMILARDQQFADGLGLDVQIRTKLVRFWSYIKSVAIRIGDDILEIQGTADLEGLTTVHYWMNFEYQGDLSTVGGFPVEFKLHQVAAHKRFFTIDLSSKYPGVKIAVTAWREFIRVEFENPSKMAFGNTVGMLGDFKTGATLARDGETVLHDFSELGNEWQVLPSDDMLFHSTEQPQFPKKCIEPEDPQGERRRRLDESNISEAQAEAACSSIQDPLDRKDCIYDVLATQDLDMTGAY